MKLQQWEVASHFITLLKARIILEYAEAIWFEGKSSDSTKYVQDMGDVNHKSTNPQHYSCQGCGVLEQLDIIHMKVAEQFDDHHIPCFDILLVTVILM